MTSYSHLCPLQAWQTSLTPCRVYRLEFYQLTQLLRCTDAIRTNSVSAFPVNLKVFNDDDVTIELTSV
jgi:hypothetical protein